MRGPRLVAIVLGASALGLLGSLTPAWGGAQMTDPDRNDRRSQKEVSLTEGAIVMPSEEGTNKESLQGAERPLSVPAPVIDGSVTHLRTPDAIDIDNARESDLDSATSY